VIDLGYPGFNSSAIQDNLRALDLAAYTYKVRDEICNHSLSNDDTIILTEQLRTLNSPECRTPCTACSKSKRIALAHYARKNNISYIALGHHLDDFLSTLLKDYYINRYYQDCGKYDWVRFRNYIQNTPIDHKGVAQQCSAGIASTMGFKLILGQGLTLFRPMILLSETNIITAISKANISTFGSGCSHSSYVSGSLPPSKREIVHAAFRIMQESNPELSSSLVPIMLASLSPSGEPLSSPRSERSRRLPDFE
jgi:tRNA(Ile)-lysidine synthase TilS/MesJ